MLPAEGLSKECQVLLGPRQTLAPSYNCGPPSSTHISKRHLSFSFFFFMLQLSYVSANILTWERQSKPADLDPFQVPVPFQEESYEVPTTPRSPEGKGEPSTKVGPLLANSMATFLVVTASSIRPGEMTVRSSLAGSQRPLAHSFSIPCGPELFPPQTAVAPLNPSTASSRDGSQDANPRLPCVTSYPSFAFLLFPPSCSLAH